MNGPVKILFIMGLSVSLEGWEYQVEYFKNMPQFSICVFDNRGAGFSGNPSSITSTLEMAKDALCLLNHLEWFSDVNLVGISLGGMISLELALLKPTLFSTLTLISTTAGRSLPPINGLFGIYF